MCYSLYDVFRGFASAMSAPRNDTVGEVVRLSIDGHQVEAPGNCLIVQAFVYAGRCLSKASAAWAGGTRLMRVMVRRSSEQ